MLLIRILPKQLSIISIVIIFTFFSLNETYALYRSDHSFNFFGSLNPVGAGARALGFGGAFISFADDATAGSWNPSCLIQLEKSEVSIVYSFDKRNIYQNFHKTTDASEKSTTNLNDLNFLSIAYKSFWNQRDFVLSLSFQNIYDLNKNQHSLYSFQQMMIDESQNNSGYIKSITPSIAFQISPEISMGISVNLFSDYWGCHWQTHYQNLADSRPYGDNWWSNTQYTNEFKFNGENINIGLLIALSQNLNLGIVYKSPFTADIDFQETFQVTGSHENTPMRTYPKESLELKIPQSYGVGISWRPDYPNFRDTLTLALDIYRTDWQNYYLRHPDGYEENLYSNALRSECNTRPTHQIRMGAEYWFFSESKGYGLPFRMGAFYDPEPTAFKPDDFWGVSFGTGFLKENIAFDIAWQYRWGNNVRETRILDEDVVQDVRQHTFYCSIIYYFETTNQ